MSTLEEDLVETIDLLNFTFSVILLISGVLRMVKDYLVYINLDYLSL